MTPPSSNNIYYFLGNITSHILHALPLYKQLGGTFIVLSEKARKEVAAYNVPVVAINNAPYQWQRFSYKLKPIHHYLTLTSEHDKTVDFLNSNAKVVIFYELYDFTSKKLSTPKTIFLTHGNMLKNYMASNNRLKTIKQYDYMAGIGPALKQRHIAAGINPEKLIDIGIARTDEATQHQRQVFISPELTSELQLDLSKKIVAYLPTFWGASSVYTTGLDIVKYIPEDYTLIFRPHPQTPKKIIRKYLGIIKNKSNVIYAPEGKYKHLNLIDIFNASSVIIGDVSSVTLEAILTYKPLIFAYDIDKNKQPESDYESIKGIVTVSEKISTENATELPEIIKRALAMPVDETLWSNTISNNFYYADGNSVKAIKGCILEL